MKCINLNQAIELHNILINETGGSAGLRNKSLLDSGLSAPFQSFEGEFLSKSITEQVVHLAFSLINNHAFVDGNKRIGLLVMLTFLELNGYKFECSDKEMITMILGVAAGTLRKQNFEKWVNESAKLIYV